MDLVDFLNPILRNCGHYLLNQILKKNKLCAAQLLIRNYPFELKEKLKDILKKLTDLTEI